jgi:hypothetical protein
MVLLWKIVSVRVSLGNGCRKLHQKEKKNNRKWRDNNFYIPTVLLLKAGMPIKKK